MKAELRKSYLIWWAVVFAAYACTIVGGHWEIHGLVFAGAGLFVSAIVYGLRIKTMRGVLREERWKELAKRDVELEFLRRQLRQR